jgi:hypothetical protein
MKFVGNTPDGKTVFYTTDQSMMSGDTDGGGEDVYGYTRSEQLGMRTRWFSTSGTDPENNVDAEFCGASDDSSVVAFETPDELVGADNDGNGYDTYRSGNSALTLASTGPDEPDVPGTQECRGVSGDGSVVAFESTVKLFSADDTNNSRDVFTFNGVEQRWVSTSPNDVATGEHAEFGAMSPDGDTVYFNTPDAMVASDTDSTDVDGYSVSPSGVTTLLTGDDIEADAGGARVRAVSKDLSTLLISTNDKYVSADTDPGESDIYARFNGGAPVLVSTGPNDLHGSLQNFQLFDNEINRKWTLSADGSIIAWSTEAQLTSSDIDAQFDVYAYITPKDAPAAPIVPIAAPTSDPTPIISSAKLNRSKFAVNKKGKALKTSAAKKGATLSYTLSEAATVTGTVFTCRKLVKTKCTGKKKSSAFKLTGKSGKNSSAFSGKIGRKTLKSGGHLLELSATDSAGQKSAVRSLGFTIVKR